MMALETKTLLDEMIRINAGDPRRIQHLVKVHTFCQADRRLGRHSRR